MTPALFGAASRSPMPTERAQRSPVREILGPRHALYVTVSDLYRHSARPATYVYAWSQTRRHKNCHCAVWCRPCCAFPYEAAAHYGLTCAAATGLANPYAFATDASTNQAAILLWYHKTSASWPQKASRERTRATRYGYAVAKKLEVVFGVVSCYGNASHSPDRMLAIPL